MDSPQEHKEHIHPLIPSQLPEFVRVDHPTLVAFLQAYYEWLEMQESSLYSPMKLGAAIDVDKTLDQFVDSFKSQYLLNFPKTFAISKENNKPVDEKKLIKNIKSFYAAKGTEKTYEFLFRILYDTNVEFYYPKRDILKLSDGKWIAKKSIKTSALQGNSVFGAAGKNIVQRNNSGTVLASAKVIDVTTYQVGANTVAEFSLSGINGTFESGDYGIEFIDSGGNARRELRVFSVVTSITITNPGTNYKVGDSVVFTPALNDTGMNATGTVQEVDTNTGAIKKIRIDNFGVNYKVAPSVKVVSSDGSGFAGSTTVGALAQYAGYYANNDSRLSTNKVLQDNHYFQNFSYVLLTEVTIDRYRDVLRKLLHPAGMGFFGRILLKRCNYGDIDKTASLLRYEMPIIGNYLPYTNNTVDDLSAWFTGTGGDVVGYVPRKHNPIITATLGNPILFGIPYQKDTSSGGLTGYGRIDTPSLSVASATANSYEKISVGYYGSLALSTTGTVKDLNWLNNHNTWARELSGIKDVSMGLYTAAAVKGDGSLTFGGYPWYAWTPRSANSNVAYLMFDVKNTPTPTDTAYKQVCCGYAGAYGLKTDGRISYWGITNGSYQTGTNLLVGTVSLQEGFANTITGTALPGLGSSGGTLSITGSSVTGPYHLSPVYSAAASLTGQYGAKGLTAVRIDMTTGLTSAASQTATENYGKYFAFIRLPNKESKPVTISTIAGTSERYISSVYLKAVPGFSGTTVGLRGVNAGAYAKLTLNEEWQRLQTPPQNSYAPRTPDAIGNTTVFELGIGNDTTNATTGCSFYMWGPQLEGPTSGTTASAYVPVVTHSVTGSLDYGGNQYWGQDMIPTGASFTQISSKSWHAAALMADGGITAWGRNDYGQCNVSADKTFKQVAAGYVQTLAVKTDGSITGWGGNGDSSVRTLLNNIPKGNNFVKVSTGYRKAAALDADGNVYLWGWNFYGEIPGATFDSSNTPFIPPFIAHKDSYGAFKFKDYDFGIYTGGGVLGAQELRSSGTGLSASDPFWIVYQHPNKKIKEKVIANITGKGKLDFLGSNNILPGTELLTTNQYAGWSASGVEYRLSTSSPPPVIGYSGQVFHAVPLSFSNNGSNSIVKAGMRFKTNKFYTFSVYAKANGFDTVSIRLDYQVSGKIGATWNLSNSTNTTVSTELTPHTILGNVWTAGINEKQNVGNGWYRLILRGKWTGPDLTVVFGRLTLYTGSADGTSFPIDPASNKGLLISGVQLEETDASSTPAFYSKNFIGSTGGVGGYWPEWALGSTTGRDDWAKSFSGQTESKYAVLQYSNETEFRKITARAFFNMPVGKEFNCKYNIADSVPYPKMKIQKLNGKIGNGLQNTYDLIWQNSNSPVTGQQNLTIETTISNPDSIPYYGATFLSCKLYWVSTQNAGVKEYLLHSRDIIYPTTTTITLGPAFSNLLSSGMFTNYPSNLGTFTLANGTSVNANGKFRVVLVYTDSSGRKIPETEVSKDFIYQYL